MTPKTDWNALKRYALTLPGAFEDHPWGEDAIKVNKKIFVFMGQASPAGISVKLVDGNMHAHALSLKGSQKTGYGLGKSGWVSIAMVESKPPLDLLKEFVEESYRAIATKKFVAQLDAR